MQRAAEEHGLVPVHPAELLVEVGDEPAPGVGCRVEHVGDELVAGEVAEGAVESGEEHDEPAGGWVECEGGGGGLVLGLDPSEGAVPRPREGAGLAGEGIGDVVGALGSDAGAEKDAAAGGSDADAVGEEIEGEWAGDVVGGGVDGD